MCLTHILLFLFHFTISLKQFNSECHFSILYFPIFILFYEKVSVLDRQHFIHCIAGSLCYRKSRNCFQLTTNSFLQYHKGVACIAVNHISLFLLADDFPFSRCLSNVRRDQFLTNGWRLTCRLCVCLECCDCFRVSPM